jgi:hypothetical protein
MPTMRGSDAVSFLVHQFDIFTLGAPSDREIIEDFPTANMKFKCGHRPTTENLVIFRILAATADLSLPLTAFPVCWFQQNELQAPRSSI